MEGHGRAWKGWRESKHVERLQAGQRIVPGMPCKIATPGSGVAKLTDDDKKEILKIVDGAGPWGRGEGQSGTALAAFFE